MSDKKKELLAKVDAEKRDSLKKMAIGTAYAVPVMATFSLDGVRNTALAQGAYGTTQVTDIQGGNNRADLRFSRAMDVTRMLGAPGGIVAKIPSCWETLFPFSKGGSWTWISSTRARWENPGACHPPANFTVLINMEPCANSVLDAEGNPVTPFSGTVTVEGTDCGG